ncbi:MAG: hypothetical protein QNJ97_14660 [Myxococcota bacterium]|nr:hypothetical protein [Myxococcota bacterium]
MRYCLFRRTGVTGCLILFVVVLSSASNADDTAVLSVEGSDISQDVTSHQRTSSMRLSGLFWTGLTGTAATGVASGVFLILANSKANKYEDGNRQDIELKTDAERFGWLGVGLGIGAGVFAAVTTVFFVADKNKHTREAAVSATVLPGTLVFRF